MPWETRHGRRYFYRNLRRGGRAVKLYCGLGEVAELAQNLENEAKSTQAENEKRLAGLVEETARIDRAIRFLDDGCRRLIASNLLIGGHYRHTNGEWRRLGHGNRAD